jgi:hypothetical protein
MENKITYERLLYFIYSEDITRNRMPTMRATKLLEDIKNIIEKHSIRGIN